MRVIAGIIGFCMLLAAAAIFVLWGGSGAVRVAVLVGAVWSIWLIVASLLPHERWVVGSVRLMVRGALVIAGTAFGSLGIALVFADLDIATGIMVVVLVVVGIGFVYLGIFRPWSDVVEALKGL